MSGAQTPGSAPPPNGADPTMEDILASIRRILSEEAPAIPEPPPVAAAPPPPEPPPSDDDVLVLDSSMLVEPAESESRSSEAELEPEPDPEDVTPLAVPVVSPEPVTAAPLPEPVGRELPLPDSFGRESLGPESPGAESLGAEPLGPELLAPEAAAAASSSVGNLVRTLAMDRSSHVYRGGPTIEDLVREEVRPLLKAWLDVNLPPLVERLVRAEIERVVARVVP